MKITSLTMRELNIPLRFKFSQANSQAVTSRSALVEIETSDGLTGYGESCPRLYVTGESLESVRADLKQLEPVLLSSSINNIEDIKLLLDAFERGGAGNSTLCGIELALLDALSRTQNRSLITILDIQQPGSLNYSLVLPLLSTKKFTGLLERVKQLKPSSIKLKVDKNQLANLERVDITRDYFGKKIPVRVDVNSGWTKEEAIKNIPSFMKHGVSSFEQPLEVGRVDDQVDLMKAFGKHASLMADESLLSFRKAKQLIDQGAFNHFNLKISKLGGIFRTLMVYDYAMKHNVKCQLGAHFGETGLLGMAGAIIGAAAPKLSHLEGALSDFLLEKDITQNKIKQDLHGIVHLKGIESIIGLGGMIDTATVARYSDQ